MGGNVPANLAPIFQQAGKANNVPPSVLAGIMSVESDFGRNQGPSSAGAVGTMQFLPSTAKGLGIDPHNVGQAVNGAAKLLNQYGFQSNPTRAIAAYNAGPGNVQAGMGYASNVLSEAKRISGELSGGTLGPNIDLTSVGFPSQTVTLGGTTSYQPTFNQAGYDKALNAYKLGTVLKMGKASDALFSGFGTNGVKTTDFNTGPSALTPLYRQGLIKTTAPNPQDYAGMKEVTSPSQTLTFPGAQGSVLTSLAAIGHSGYVNPIPGAQVGRTDMGIDANLKPGDPILAIGNAKVLGIMGNWYAGQPYMAYQLLDGPAKGRVVYVAEQITNMAKPGTVVKAGQPVANYAPAGTGIEMGWANPSNWQQTLAQGQGNTGGSGHSNSPAGQNFRSFLGL